MSIKSSNSKRFLLTICSTLAFVAVMSIPTPPIHAAQIDNGSDYTIVSGAAGSPGQGTTPGGEGESVYLGTESPDPVPDGAVVVSQKPHLKAIAGNGGSGEEVNSPDSSGDGGDGGNATTITDVDSDAWAEAYAGSGGYGGSVAWEGSDEGVGGDGGDGGIATAIANGTDGYIWAKAVGGDAGDAGASATGEVLDCGIAGTATAEAYAIDDDGIGLITVRADAVGGNGGSGDVSTNGVAASATADATSSFGGNIVLYVNQQGGGGGAQWVSNAGDGAASTLENAATGYSQTLDGQQQIIPNGGGEVELIQTALGGGGGNGYDDAGEGGSATSTLEYAPQHGESSYTAETVAVAGSGGHCSTTGGNGAAANAHTSLIANQTYNSDTNITSKATAYGGHGGNGGGLSGTGGNGEDAHAIAEAESINGDASAVANSTGGIGGGGYTAGNGGDATSEATAESETGEAHAYALAIAGGAGSGSSVAGTDGTATVSANAISNEVTVDLDISQSGGIVRAEVTLTPIAGSTSLAFDYDEYWTLTPTSKTLMIDDGPSQNGADLTIQDNSLTISAATTLACDTTFNIRGNGSSLTFSSAPTLGTGVLMTKAGPESLIVSDANGWDLSDNGLGLIVEADSFGTTQITVTGGVTLGDTLALSLAEDFAGWDDYYGYYYETITLIHSNTSISGTFDDVDSVLVNYHLGLLVSYTANDVVLTAAIPSDANTDRLVNLTDLQILGDNWGSTGRTWAQADFNGDGCVNLADLQILNDHWNWYEADVSFDTALQMVGLIPEPASALLFGVGLLLLAQRRRWS